MNQEIRKIVSIMDEIEYGYKNEDGVDIVEANPNGWSKFYKLQTPDELLESKCGICWDQVELERKLFEDKKISFKTYFIYIVDDEVGYDFLETRNVTPVCQEGSHNQAVMEESVKQFTDCKYLVASRIGSGAIQALTAAGITGMELPGSIDEAMLKVWKYNRVQGLFN